MSRFLDKGELRGPSIEARLAQTANDPLSPLPPDLERSLRADLAAETERLKAIETEWDKADKDAATTLEVPAGDWVRRQSQLRTILKNQDESLPDLIDGYLEIRERWNTQVHEVLGQIRQGTQETERETLPPFNFAVYSRVRDSDEGQEYRKIYLELESRASTF